ncbi:MAG: hypothetical protein H7Z13_05325 [Ferruginibacter sp.]|nr:hypothetical protein [Ferruginibacter sp.]
MKRLYIPLIAGITMLAGCSGKNNSSSPWSLMLQQPGKAALEIIQLPADLSKPFEYSSDADGIHIRFSLQPKTGYTVFKVVATKESGQANVFFSLQNNYANAVPYNFDGEVKGPEIYRQSRHDINAWTVKGIAEQAVPVIALKNDLGYTVALNGSPALYDNFTSQAFYTNEKIAQLSSGDNGKSPGLQPDTAKTLKMDYNADKTQIFAPGKVLPYYHTVKAAQPHQFEGIIFASKATTQQQLRRDINQNAADHFSNGKYSDYFGAVSFTTAYMNLRINETGKSKYWVVPSVEYNNTQYCRDAFWIANMLPPDIASDCLKNELDSVNMYAEYPLITVIWAYKAWKQKNPVNMANLQKYVTAIDGHSRNNYYYSYNDYDGRLDFQYWNDLIAFDTTDVVTYNQGFYALAIQAAKEMGLKTTSDPAKALTNYQQMFNSAGGFYPISKKKNSIMGPDPVVPDLLSQLYFNKPMLDTKSVTQHYKRLVKYSKTGNGFKVVSLPDGKFLPDSLYDVKGYQSQVTRAKMPDGQYCKGGSYFLYDNLFLIDAYLHGIKEAAGELAWRVSLDFTKGGTTFECLNTVTGEPWKPNMGWNVAIYAIWKQLVDSGKADRTLFETIDKLAENYNKN